MPDQEIKEKTNSEMTPDERLEAFTKKLLEALVKFPNAPVQAQIESWKKEYRDIFASALDDSEIYIFRPLSRKEHLNLKSEIVQKQMEFQRAREANPKATVLPPRDGEYEEQVVRKCILWGSSMESLDRKAGSIDVVGEQILLNSNFMSPALAAQLVIKL